MEKHRHLHGISQSMHTHTRWNAPVWQPLHIHVTFPTVIRAEWSCLHPLPSTGLFYILFKAKNLNMHFFRSWTIFNTVPILYGFFSQVSWSPCLLVKMTCCLLILLPVSFRPWSCRSSLCFRCWKILAAKLFLTMINVQSSLEKSKIWHQVFQGCSSCRGCEILYPKKDFVYDTM